jgi:type VI secretion system protein ImpB
VQLSYDVQVGDAIEQKELPFVVGVLGEFSGQADPTSPCPS